MKVLWFDVETTGLNAVKNDIITIAGIIDIDHVTKEKFYFKVQPRDWDNISVSRRKSNQPKTRDQFYRDPVQDWA